MEQNKRLQCSQCYERVSFAIASVSMSTPAELAGRVPARAFKAKKSDKGECEVGKTQKPTAEQFNLSEANMHSPPRKAYPAAA
eukprot:1161547-Pelagomonas_calceolata.AAC.6